LAREVADFLILAVVVVAVKREKDVTVNLKFHLMHVGRFNPASIFLECHVHQLVMLSLDCTAQSFLSWPAALSADSIFSFHLYFRLLALVGDFDCDYAFVAS